MMWDIYISYAWEDKDEVARPLANELIGLGLRVWYDEFTLHLGDSLRRTIDRGLKESRYGVIILSRSFFSKSWPTRELDALWSREISGPPVLFPIWHNVTREEVQRYSPILADRVAISTSRGIK